MESHGTFDIVTLTVLADSIILFLAGLYDLKRVVFSNTVYYGLLTLAGLPLGLIWWRNATIILIALPVTILLVALILLGYLGLADYVVAIRIPMLVYVFSQAPASAVAFIIGYLLAWLYFIVYYVRPILCPGERLLGGKVYRVKASEAWREYVLPAYAGLNDDVEEWRRRIVKRNICVEAVVGVPFVFVYSAGYLAATLALLALYV